MFGQLSMQGQFIKCAVIDKRVAGPDGMEPSEAIIIVEAGKQEALQNHHARLRRVKSVVTYVRVLML